MILIGVIVGTGQAIGIVASPVDAVNYWIAGTSAHLYPEFWTDTSGAFLFYPPPVAQLSTLLQPIGWNAFIVSWTTILFACFWWCARGWSLPLVSLGVLVVLGVPIPGVETFLGYALLGNMQWLLAVAVVVSMKHPTGWAALALTKTGPAVGGLWHVSRGEWAAVRRAAVASALVVFVSFAFAPQMWIDWLGFVMRNVTMANPPMALFPIPFYVRFVGASALVVGAARADKAWLVPVAAGMALPALWGLGFLPFWVAAMRLRSPAERRSVARVVAVRRSKPDAVTIPAKLVPVMDPDVARSDVTQPAVRV